MAGEVRSARRGKLAAQSDLLCLVSPEQFVPADHPLRATNPCQSFAGQNVFAGFIFVCRIHSTYKNSFAFNSTWQKSVSAAVLRSVVMARLASWGLMSFLFGDESRKTLGLASNCQ